ncbi:MAG: hypothetical protein K0S33_3567 [Bacteroidetes bacterium]|jgi:hypothetical protein|nr:hypothetical protein [Bacteroidota bacterium]
MELLKNKILDAVNRLQLDLKGKVVLTEAATGAYVVTPVIAALAGAEVYAFTKSTRYGTADFVKEKTMELLALFDKKDLKLTIIEEITPEIIAKADIITNSGHLRPLNKEKLQHAKQGAVIPLMYEAWEWREGDVDMQVCNEKSIRIGATNERHPEVDVFNYLGDMALKMIFDAGLCPYKNNFILLCNNDFGPFIAKVLSKVCANLGVCDTAENLTKYEGLKIDWLGNFPDLKAGEKYRKCDAVLFTAYPFENTWIGPNAPISIQKLKEELDNPFILRYAGHIDEEACKNELNFHPEHVHAGHMGILPSAIGFDPIIRLQSGGLKAGQLLLENNTQYQGTELMEPVTANSILQAK